MPYKKHSIVLIPKLDVVKLRSPKVELREKSATSPALTAGRSARPK